MSELPIIWDLETHRIAPGMPAPKMVCMAMADRQRNITLYEREEGLDIAERLVREEFTANHHIFYDLGVLAADRPNILPAIFKALDLEKLHCTKIRQMMTDNARGELKFIWNEETLQFNKQNYYLARLVQRHLGYDIEKTKKQQEGESAIWRLRFHELDGIPISEWPEGPAEYAMGDPDYTQRVWRSQQENDIAPDVIPGFKSQMQAAWALNLLGTWGVRTDPIAVREYKEELTTDFRVQVNKCREFGFRRENRSRDMKKIKAAVETWYLSNDMDMRLTATGQIATDRKQLTATDHPGLCSVAESVKTEKMLSTYVPALERGTVVPINPNYNPIIETFRTSCSGGMKIGGVPVGANLQNLPRKGKVRQCFVPRLGHVFVFFDYDTLEMRTLGQVCLDLFGYSKIAQAANEGLDFHTALAASMYGVSYSEAVTRLKDGDKKMKTARQYSKIGNYGFAGGMGPDAFISYAEGYGIIVSHARAKELRNGFRKQWPEMVEYFNYCSFLCSEGNADKIVFVRSGMIRGDVRYTATCNGFFQHLAAMGAKAALYEVVRECYVDPGSPLYGCRPWLFAHDEIGMEVPYEEMGPKRAHEASMRLGEIMVDEMKAWCPDVAIGVSGAMTRRWYKGPPAFYKDGWLAPCKPEGEKWVLDL